MTMAMREHPHSVWTLGGIPAGAHERPAAGDIETWGRTWAAATDDYLIGVSARAYGTNAETAAMPAFIESQRRLRGAIGSFEAESRTAVQNLIETEQRL